MTFPANLVVIYDKICGELYNRSNSHPKFKKKSAVKFVGVPPSSQYLSLQKTWFLGLAKNDTTFCCGCVKPFSLCVLLYFGSSVRKMSNQISITAKLDTGKCEFPRCVQVELVDPST
jgi:hypothetical protein